MKDIEALLNLSPEKLLGKSVLNGVADLKAAVSDDDKAAIATQIKKQRELLEAIELLSK